ncbi:MAG: hypothetical protein ACOY90_07080 [Candidatus Zhuqueibacterota bacterium]
MFNLIFRSRYLIAIFLVSVFSCKDADFEKKVDPGLKLQLQQLKQAGQLNTRIPVIFKVNEPIGEEHKAFLSNRDIKIMANIGTIYTASVPAHAVYDLSKMKFVETIQSSRTVKATPSDSLGKIQKY